MFNQTEPYVYTAAAFTAAATTKTLSAQIILPGDGPYIVRSAHLERITDMSGGAVSACVVEVGISGNTTGLIGSSDVFTGAKATAKYTSGAGNLIGTVLPAGTAVHVKMTTTTANTSALTAGKLAVSLVIARFNGKG